MNEQDSNDRVATTLRKAWPCATVDYSSVLNAVQRFATSGCADADYLTQLGIGKSDKGVLISRIWEALLYQRFAADGWTITGGGAGPDFKLKKNDYQVLVEAVAPQPGDPSGRGMSEAWQDPERRKKCVHENIYDEMLSRLTGVIKTKKNKQIADIKKRSADPKLPFVIAVNDTRLGSAHGQYPATGLPLIVHAVLPIGTPAYTEDAETGAEIDRRYLQRRLKIPQRKEKPKEKPKGEPKEEPQEESITAVFWDPEYECVSAVIYAFGLLSDAPAAGERTGPASIIVVHNPKAKNPLRPGCFSGAIEYVVELERVNSDDSTGDVEAFTIRCVTPPSARPRTV